MSVKENSGGKQIPLILISGFLGSGKTSFLNYLFEKFPDKKFGIIINDFGALSVDAAEVKQPEGSIISELNNGQIFCSCLSGSFIKSVSAYAETDIDYLLVEASGLAKPSPLLEIVEAIKKINGDRFLYYGMISLVDSSSYLKLSGVLKAVDEQISYSDLVLLNKIDTADAATVKKAEMKIMTVNPGADIVKTEYGRIPPELFLGLKEKSILPGPDRRFAGWGKQGRPVPVLLKAVHTLEIGILEDFVNDPGGEYYRMKGRLETDSGSVFVDCTVNSSSIVKDEAGRNPENGLVIILPADDNIIKSVKDRASKIFDSVE